MLTTNRYAFKEWAAVCTALASGRQALILRKGGIHEGREGFRVEHREFWLFPTRFHQAPEELEPDAGALIAATGDAAPGIVRIGLYAVVEEVICVTNEARLPMVRGEHILSDAVVTERFHYREPGLFALAVRAFRARTPIEIPDSPHFAGCRSWVDLPAELSTAGLEPVLSDEDFRRRLQQIRFGLIQAVA